MARRAVRRDRATQHARVRARFESVTFAPCCRPQFDIALVTITRVEKTYYVYIMASRRNGTLYIGVTNDVLYRALQHREGKIPGFTKKYGVKMLVYFETFGDISLAIHRETRLKKWKRSWKISLIEKDNPDWIDLYETLTAAPIWPDWLIHANEVAAQK
jgi:putative endonuclease